MVNDIKVCFIPPKGLEDYMGHGNMVMGLAQLISPELRDYVYVNTVQKLVARDKFVIMDNGANEGENLSQEDLEKKAFFLGANELVLPDVLTDSAATLSASISFLQNRSLKLSSYMGVVQGTNVDELKSLIEAFAEEPDITTLGLPRLLLKHISLSVRIDMANWINENFPKRFEIHLLGASSLWLREAYCVARYASHIRSIDTSLPYNYGLMGVRINTTEKKIDRPANYFTKVHRATALTTILYNEEVYKEWCRPSR